MSDDSKALATSTPESQAVAQLKALGAAEVTHRREVGKIYKQIEGMTWGSGQSMVHGSQLSQGTKGALAEFCETTGANILTQVDILGGKPFLNANYWADNINQQELFHRYEQRDISPSMEQALRDRAARAKDMAQHLEGADKSKLLARSFLLEEEAEDMAIARAQWGPRETATDVVETTIWRFFNAAPIHKIRSGEITDFEKYLVPVSECNWAGGMGQSMASAKKWDPIGDAHPATTARTRSLRRCAAKAFSTWMANHQGRVERAEKMIEADFEIIMADQEDRAASLPVPGGPQAVTFTNGEPEAMNPEEAEDLPIEGVDVEPVAVEPKKKKAKKAPAPAPAPAPPPAEPVPFDASDARKALFATLRDAGVATEDRKTWAVSKGLPESTSLWLKADYDKAMEFLIAPTREKVLSGCEALEMDLTDLCLEVLGQDAAKYLKDWNALAVRLQDEMEGSDL